MPPIVAPISSKIWSIRLADCLRAMWPHPAEQAHPGAPTGVRVSVAGARGASGRVLSDAGGVRSVTRRAQTEDPRSDHDQRRDRDEQRTDVGSELADHEGPGDPEQQAAERERDRTI